MEEPAKLYPQIHTFKSGEKSIFSNAYLVEGQTGIVVIDSTLSVSSSKELRQKLDDLHKPLLAVLLTHGHPDHYNGVTEVVKGLNVPIIATEGVDGVIKKYDAAKDAQWRPMFGDEWPLKRTFPTQIAKDDESIVFDSMSFTVHDLGAGESHSDSYWTMESNGKKYAFIGDTVLQGVHSYMIDAHSTEWLKNIEKMKKDLKDMTILYPGHGDAGDLSLFDTQKAYIETYRNAVKKLAQGKQVLTDDAKKELQKEMMEFLPTEKMAFVISLGADPVAKELAIE